MVLIISSFQYGMHDFTIKISCNLPYVTKLFLSLAMLSEANSLQVSQKNTLKLLNDKPHLTVYKCYI